MPQRQLCPGYATRPGIFCFPGVVVPPRRGDGLLYTAEAAALVGRKPATIRSWRRRGRLKIQGLDEAGEPLHTPEAVRAAARLARENGLRTSGIDPARLCTTRPAA